MPRESRSRSEGLQALYDRYIGDDPKRVEAFEVARSNAEIAGSVYKLRTEAGLSQRDLAQRVGTTASVICRLEDADYEGHSLLMLQRIAAAVGKQVEIRFKPIRASKPKIPKITTGSVRGTTKPDAEA